MWWGRFWTWSALMESDHPRVTIVTNGNAFSNIALTTTFDGLADSVEFQVVTTSGLRRTGGNRLTEAARLFRRWGWRYTGYKLATYAVPLMQQLFTGTPRFVACACRDRGIPVHGFRSVNTPAARDWIASFAPDLLISYSCPYRIRPKTLALSRIGCLNVHSSLLPAYAGVCTYIHVLADGETTTGVTVHEMVNEFDAGRIVAQRELAIAPGISVCALFAEQSQVAGSLLVDAVRLCLSRGEVGGWVQDTSRRSYRGEPKADDIFALRARGHRLARFSELASLQPQPVNSE